MAGLSKYLVVAKYTMRVSTILVHVFRVYLTMKLLVIVELAVIIGKSGRDIQAADADDYIGGKYCIQLYN